MDIFPGVLVSYDPTTYTASVQLLEAGSTQLTGVPIANCVDGTSAVSGAACAVLFLDETDPSTAVVIATYVNGSLGLPTPQPGRVCFTTPHQFLTAVVLTSGSVNTTTITGAGSIPAGATAVLVKAYFSSPTVGAWVGMCGHGGDSNNTDVLGNLQVANQTVNGNSILPLSVDGKIDVKANGGTCTVNLYTYGYIT